MLAAWGESDLNFEEEKLENEVANLCLMAEEDLDEEVYDSSHDFFLLLMNYFKLLKTYIQNLKNYFQRVDY